MWVEESPSLKETFDVPPDFFKQFCHRNKLIVLGRDLNNKNKDRLQDNHLILIRDYLSDNPHITSINLSYNQITSEGVKTLANILVHNTQVKELILSNNNIDGKGIEYLAEVKYDIQLECLRLNGNKFEEDHAKHIIEFLTNNTVLKYLDLGETGLTNDVLEEISPALACSKLSGLVISSIIGFNRKTYDTAAIVRHITARNKSLTMLYLRKLQLTDHDVEVICSGLEYHPGLKLMDMSCNNISDIGGANIVNYIFKNENLEGLFLSHNRLSDGTSYDLSTLLLSSNITMLDVSYNSITDRGLLYLLDLVQAGSGRSILLWGNSIGPRCCGKLRTLHDQGRVSAHRCNSTS